MRIMKTDIRLCVMMIVSFPLLTLMLLGLGACAGKGGEDGPQIEGDFIWAVINEEKGYAYFRARGTVSTPKRAAKVAVGEGDGMPRFVGMVEEESEEFQTARGLTSKKGNNPQYRSRSAVDPANGYTYSYSFKLRPGCIVKRGGGTSSSVPLPAGPGRLRNGGCILIDASRGFIYVGTARGPAIPAEVVKIALGEGAQPPRVVGAVTLSPGECNVSCGVMDSANGYAYFGTTSGVVKIAPGDGFEPPVRVGALVLDAAAGGFRTAVIDTLNGYAYFANAYTIVKVALGEGAEPPALVGAITVHRKPRSASMAMAVVFTTLFFLFLCIIWFVPCLLFTVPVVLALRKAASRSRDVASPPPSVLWRRLWPWGVFWAVALVSLFVIGYIGSGGITYRRQPLGHLYRMGHGAMYVCLFFGPIPFLLATAICWIHESKRAVWDVAFTHLVGCLSYAIVGTLVYVCMYVGPLRFLHFTIPAGYNPGFPDIEPVIFYTPMLGLMILGLMVAYRLIRRRGQAKEDPS